MQQTEQAIKHAFELISRARSMGLTGVSVSVPNEGRQEFVNAITRDGYWWTFDPYSDMLLVRWGNSLEM